MRIGVIGTGWMGKNHMRIYNDLRNVDEVIVTDSNETIGKQAAEQFGVKFVSGVDELLSKVDAVSICVPTALHQKVAEQVLAKGVHCLIEKPLANSVEEAEKIMKAAEKSGAIAAVGHIERFNPVVMEVKRILDKPYYMEVERHNPHFGRITDADVINDLMIHDIDMLWNYLFAGKKYRILGAGGVRNKLLELAVVLVDFEGCIVKLSGSRLSLKKTRQIQVEEAEKTIVGDLMTQEIYVHKKAKQLDLVNINYAQESVVDKVLLSKLEPLREELRAFINCVKNGKPFPILVKDGVRALQIGREIRERIEKSES